MARICVVTAGHLSTCPRMLKAADAFADAGHRVRVVSTRLVEWATAADRDVRARRSDAWEWAVVAYDRRSARSTYLRSGVRMRTAQWLAKLVRPSRCPVPAAVRAYSRAHSELVRAALAQPADFYYGGTTGALAAVAEAGCRAGAPYALDLEDFHSAEQEDTAAGRLAHALAERVERAVLPGAVFLTAAGSAIADAYAEKYALRPISIHNVFPLPAEAPELAPRLGEGLRLYWFSQTIGPGRGLEDAIRAMGFAGLKGELHLRGRAVPDYMSRLRQEAASRAPKLEVVHHELASPDAMVELCRGYDVGLALEPGHVRNSDLALSNKAFTYILAGLPVCFTDTEGQRFLAKDLDDGAILFPPGDVRAFAEGLKRWARDRESLGRAKAAAWEAARRRWHWEHPEERGALLNAVAGAVGHQSRCGS